MRFAAESKVRGFMLLILLYNDYISNTNRLLSVDLSPPLIVGVFSSTSIAILLPVGDGMRALIFVGSSIGGEINGGC